MPQQDPWAEFRVTPQQGPSSSDPVIAPPNPYKESAEQRAQSAEVRAQQDQVMQGENLRISQERLRLSEEEAAQKRAKEASGFDATEGERKAGAFLIRALGANDSYEGAGVGPRSYVGQAMANNAPDLLNTLPGAIGNSPARQVADSAQDEFIAASLRQDSGAAIPPEELERQRRIYFPMPGDGPDVIAQKREARIRAIEGLKQSSGRLLDQTMARWEQMRQGTQESGPDEQLRAELDRLVRGGATIDQLNAILPPGTDPIDPQGYQSIRDYMAQHPEYQGGFFRVETGPAQPTAAGAGDQFLGQLGDATLNVGAGLVQGAGGLYDLGVMAGDAVEYGLRQGGGALLDLGGAPQAAEWWRGDFKPSPTVYDAVEQAVPTQPGYEGSRLASQLVGGAMVPIGPKAAPRVPNMNTISTPAREVIQAGKDAGVRVMTSDVRPPTSFMGKVTRAAGERIPVAGTGGPRAAQQAERVEAVRRLASDYGVDGQSDFLVDVAKDFAATRGKQLSNLTRAKDTVIDGIQGAVPTPNAIAEIDRQVARLSSVNAEKFAPVIRELEGFKQVLSSGKTLREVEGNRKLLGDLFNDPNLAAIQGEGQKAINAIYGPLRDDMGAFIKQAGGDLYSRWSGANKRLSELAGELDSATFKSVLSKTETTPEDVARLLYSKKPSEVQRLYSNLSPAGQQKARAGIIALAVEKAGGLEALSPDRFANAIAQNSKAAGIVFEGAERARLEGLQRVLQATKQAGVASAAPPTGVQSTPIVGGYAAGSFLGAGAIPWLATAGGIARLYESAATRNLLIGLSKTKPGTPAEGEWLQRISKAVASQGAAMNDNMAASAAAQNQQGQ